MASSSKRSWKLQEFVAHNANVNCLALGHKSGRVLATGGDDKKVNLWAVGKHNCIMSLSGHATPIECVRFNHTEELVCAGSQTGALKVWDLEAAKLVKTLTGHKAGISALDFHPYGDFLASGSSDSSIKLWDVRRKGCILSLKGHRLKVNSIKFSPDGQWIASSGEDAIVKVWDLRAGRLLHEFNNHTNSVTSVEFHPHEFLLASGGLDRTVNFWDLENFQLVSSEKDVGAVKCLWFNPDGECLFTGVTDSLKVHGWEPSRMFDSLPISWGKVYDIASAHQQLVGASFHLTNVTIYIVDLKKVQPFGGPTTDMPTSPFSHGQSVRKSFSKERPLGLRPKAKLDVKTIEESTSGTDPEEDFSADITNLKDYTEVFKPNRALVRTPPPEEPFMAPESDADPTEPQILSAAEDDFTPFTLSQLTIRNSPPAIRFSPPQRSPPQLRHSPPELLTSPPRSLNPEPELRIPSSTPYSRSQSNLEQIFKSRDIKLDPSTVSNDNNRVKNQTVPKYELQRQYSCKDVPEKLPSNNNNGIKHSASEANLNSNFVKSARPTSRKNSFSKPSRNSSIPNISRIPNPVSNKNSDDHNFKKPELLKSYNKYSSSTNSEEHVFKKPEPPKALKLTDDYAYKRSDPMDIDSMLEPTRQSFRSSPEYERSPIVPTPSDKPIGLDLEEFLPSNLRSSDYNKRLRDESEDEALEAVSKDHKSTMAVLTSRARAHRMAYQHFRNNTDSKTAVEKIINMNDISVIHDVLNVLINRHSFWSLDMCVVILPKVHDLIQSRLELHIKTGCEAVRCTLRNFSALIRTNMLAPCSGYSVDIPREERFQKCRKCYERLMDIRDALGQKLGLPGELGATMKELHSDLCHLCVDNH